MYNICPLNKKKSFSYSQIGEWLGRVINYKPSTSWGGKKCYISTQKTAFLFPIEKYFDFLQKDHLVVQLHCDPLFLRRNAFSKLRWSFVRAGLLHVLRHVVSATEAALPLGHAHSTISPQQPCMGIWVASSPRAPSARSGLHPRPPGPGPALASL